MDLITLLAYFLIAWGLATMLTGIFKPRTLWKNPKIQGFISLLTEKGTAIFFLLIGLAALVGGIALLLR